MANNSGTEDYVAEMDKVIAGAWDCLNAIWEKFGYDEDSFKRRQKTVVKHVSELLTEMVQEAQEKLNTQQQKLDNLMMEIMQLAKDLSIEQVPELDAACGKTLLEMERIFLEVANTLRSRKAKRMEKYENVNQQLIEICEELDETPMRIEFEGIPADSQVAKLEQHLALMHQEKTARIEKFNALRCALSELFEVLEIVPQTDLELFIANHEDEINSSRTISLSGLKALSSAILDKMEDMRSKLANMVEANKVKGEEYWQKIRDLWSRLACDDEEHMEAFRGLHQPYSTESFDVVFRPSVLKGMELELQRLEEEKRRNMSRFVQQVREELSDLWLNKCFMTSMDVRFIEPNYLGLTAFTIQDFNSDLYTEELLEKHEREVEYWRSFVERNKPIIDGVTKRGHMFAQYKTLDQKSDDPSRLANRGGALLKEEKERKKLEKLIPKLESELKALSDAFEVGADDGHGMRKFLVYGRTLQEMIEQDWEQFHEEKRLRKEAKKKPEAGDAKNKTLMTTQMGPPGSARKRPATPSSALKGATTPKKNKTNTMTPGKTFQSPYGQSSVSSAGSAQKRPFASKDNFALPSSGTVTRSAKLTPSKTPVLSRQASSGKIPLPSKLTGKEQVPPSKNHSKETVVSPVASYSEFTDHLLCQSTLNSSVAVPIQKVGGAGAAPTTPTKSTMTLAPAKLPLSDNCF